MCTNTFGKSGDLRNKSLRRNRVFVIIFTRALDLNKKWEKYEPDLVFGVCKSLDGLVSVFNTEFTKRQVHAMNKKSILNVEQSCSDEEEKISSLKDTSVLRAASDLSAEEIQLSIANNPSEIIPTPNSV